MEKRRYIRRMLRMAALAVGMLVGGASAWGQQTYTISPQSGKTFPQENIPTLVDTVYVDDNEERTLSLGNYNYYYYFRWYHKSGDEVNTANISRVNNNDLRQARETAQGNVTSFFWYHKLTSSHQNAARINYEANTVVEDSVFCDLSFYVDGLGINPQPNQWNNYELTEPTISKRYKFIIKPASEMRERLSHVTGTAALDTFYITVPQGATGVNLQMDLAPENYFWDNNQGDSFRYSIVGAGNNYQNLSSDNKLIRLGSEYADSYWGEEEWHDYPINSETTVEVYARDGNTNSPCLARFILTPQANSEFDPNPSDKERNPGDYPNEYAEIGSVDFDFDGTVTNFNWYDNMSKNCVPPSNTTYSFADPTLDWINPEGYMPEDTYGLYRSANVSGKSQKTTPRVSNGWGGEYHSTNGYNNTKQGKTYGWYYTKKDRLSNKVLYDRTYYDKGEYGFFYYVNASTEAGRIVTIPIDGIICANTELTVTAWVADITDIETPPNVSLVLRGENSTSQTSGVLHRFSSGAMTRSSDTDRANWKQLCYKITVSREMLADYDEFFVDLYNNAPNTDGADYAIDDIRIYKTLPNIQVRRENACDASTLIVSTDYATILRNMGWKNGDQVASEDLYNYNNLHLRKYRYGLMGENHQYLNSVVGNVYFAFLTEDMSDWVIVNKNAVGISEIAARAIRIPVSTVQSSGVDGYEFYTDSRETAMINEQKMNLRAVKDYNQDVSEWQSKDPDGNHAEIPVAEIGIPGEDGFKEDLYQEATETLYNRLNIPRLRCPWYVESEGRLYLAIVDVDDTDLKYRDQEYTNEAGEVVKANGKYNVLSFSAADVAGFGYAPDEGGTEILPPGSSSVDPDDPCALVSPFTVQPAATILIKTAMGEPETAACAGSLRRITAELNGYNENGEPVDLDEVGISYLFDWYLGSIEAYRQDSIDNKNISIKDVLEDYRDQQQDYGVIIIENVNNWSGQGSGDGKPRLIKLLEDGLLLTGSEGGKTFDLELPETDKIVAIPYVYEGRDDDDYTFCSDQTELTLPVEELDIPVLNAGFPGISYPFEGSAPLRLGLRNMIGTTELKIPISNHNLSMAETAAYLGVSGTPELSFREGTSATLTKVGTVKDLHIPKDYDGNSELATITVTWDAKATQSFKEGQEYELLFQFVQYTSEDKLLSSQCDGLASLTIKVVPEYLTWQESATDWYNENSSWKQSNEEELFMGSYDGNKDVNGDDDVTVYTYSPLYFTKITIPENKEMVLDDPTVDGKGTSTVDNIGDVKYEMAVDTVEAGGVEVKPYYINKVSEIYFKPGATLLNQQYLTYDTARVEFNMTEGQSYWLASPLQGVYAGDMYAPTSGGEQKTPAFKHISFNTTDYDRWDPAFYQKAWDKAITYSNVENPYGGTISPTDTSYAAAVKSNWSIEYNDVWVPYSIGKGFYARVEGKNVKVRLPKADTDYMYYATKALSEKPKSRTGNGQLSEISEAGETTIRLTDVDGDGEHFLVGNPYMAYISMDEFFKVNAPDENPTLNKKYWIINNGVAEVGTPDIKWEETTGHTGGYIAPMQAFFVERAGYNPSSPRGESAITGMTITFTTDMMVDQATATSGITTRAYTASNPQLTLTASSVNGKSRAAVIQKSDASNQYESDKDAVTLLDSELDAPTVYTVAGNYAAAVNAIHDYKNVPLGVYADADEEVELTIEGASQLVEPLYLYDAVTRSTTPIEGDSYTLNLQGSSHGRYFLTTDEGITVESDIRIYSPADGQLIIASTPSDKLKHVQVYDLSGRVVDSRQNIGLTTCQISVPGGIYIIRAESEHGEAQAKLKVK